MAAVLQIGMISAAALPSDGQTGDYQEFRAQRAVQLTTPWLV